MGQGNWPPLAALNHDRGFRTNSGKTGISRREDASLKGTCDGHRSGAHPNIDLPIDVLGDISKIQEEVRELQGGGERGSYSTQRTQFAGWALR